MRVYDRAIRHRYGTYRGLIRLWLAWLEWRLGRLSAFDSPDLSRVGRLVFVCLGNVCRSPYAHIVAAERLSSSGETRVASCGLSTTTGMPADPDARRAARRVGRDLDSHAATDLKDFEVRDDDLFLVMEVRQAHRLRARLGDSSAQIALLGVWSKPRRLHIHDPMTLSDGYFDSCYRSIESAVDTLVARWQAARQAVSGSAASG